MSLPALRPVMFGHPVDSGTKGQNAHTPTHPPRGTVAALSSPILFPPPVFLFSPGKFQLLGKGR